GFIEDPVRDRFPLTYTGDAGNDVVQALQVLDVDRRPHVDSGVEQLLDVLPALGMPRPWFTLDEIRVRKLVHQQCRWCAAQRRIEIKLAPRDTVKSGLQERQLLEPVDQA